MDCVRESQGPGHPDNCSLGGRCWPSAKRHGRDRLLNGYSSDRPHDCSCFNRWITRWVATKCWVRPWVNDSVLGIHIL